MTLLWAAVFIGANVEVDAKSEFGGYFGGVLWIR